MNCTCGARDAGLPDDAHAADCRIRTGFIPNDEPVTAGYGVANPRYHAPRHRRTWRDLRMRRPTVVGALNAFGLSGFALAGAMLHPVAGVAILAAACLVFAWLIDG